MKQKQNFLLFGSNHLRVIKNFNFLSFFFALIIMISCNTKEKKADTKLAGNDTAQLAVKNGPSPMTITVFKKYKIEKNQIDLSYSKLILTVVLDDLADPSSMNLYAFPSKPKTGTGADPGTPVKAAITTIDAATFGTKGIMINNNEIILTNYDWTNIDYVILEPTRIIDNLGFNITAFKKNTTGGGSDTAVAIPDAADQVTKPSPPAPPSLIPKYN